MNQVAKLLIIDNQDKHLLMYRNDHPVLGNDPDLPGGTLEEGESPFETMLREVHEEAGLVIDGKGVELVYSGKDYSPEGTHYHLFLIRLNERPAIVTSWEHSSYEWLDRSVFLARSKHAKDTYMHMVTTCLV